MSNEEDGFGEPNFNGTNFARNYRLRTPKDGESSTSEDYRIMPPVKGLRETGEWNKYHGTHFGFKGRNRKDATKLSHRTFKCIEDKNRKTGIIYESCPECDSISEMIAKRDAAEAQAKKEGRTKEEIEIILAPFKAWLREHNVDRKYHINVMNTKGEFGVLTISHKCYLQLRARLDDLQKANIKPFDVNKGVFFTFTRTGARGNEITDTVAIAKTVTVDANGEETSKTKWAPLTDVQKRQALKVLPDLREVVTILPKESIKALVANKGGDPDVTDAIFDAAQPQEKAPERPEANEPAPAPKPQAPAATPKVQAKDDDEAALEAQLAALRAAKAAKAEAPKEQEKKATSSSPAADVATGDVYEDDLDDDAFIQHFDKAPTPQPV